MRTVDSCPSAEQLAVFAEGRLTGDHRSVVIAHLVQCPRCREVAAETIQVATAMEDVATGAPDAARFAATQARETAAPEAETRASSRQRFPWWPAAAAAAVAASLLVVGFLAWRGGPGPEITEPDPGAMVLQITPDTGRYLDRAAELARQVAAPSEVGGGGAFAFGGAISPAKAAFRIGVDLIRLQVGLGQGNEEMIQAAGRRAASSLNGIEGSDDLVAAFETLLPEETEAAPREETEAAPRTGLEETAPAGAGAFTALVRRTASRLDSQGLGASMALGAWAELGRLAVAAGDTAHFDAVTVKTLRLAIADEPFPQGIDRTLGDIEAMSVDGDLAAGELLPDEVSRLQRLLRDLIEMI